jgi:Cof subfamily protein (haloacid dehalogenase superfamily)
MSRFRLVALDIDGTLLTSRREVSPATHAAVRAVHSRGVRVVLVTGRRYPSARRVLDELALDVPLIVHNGGLVVDGGAIVRCLPLDRETARRVVRLGREQRVDPVVHYGQRGEGQLLVEGLEPSNTPLAYYVDRSHPDVRTVPDLEAAMEEDPIQVMFGGPVERMAALWPVLGASFGREASITRTVYKRLGATFIDVLRSGVSKGEALAFLCASRGIARDEVLAIGDNWNDLEMLRSAGLGLVMGNADPEVLAAGFGRLPTNDEDGVAAALHEHVLNEG